jgi:hypothetical protein
MHSPTHAIPMNRHTPGQASMLMEMAQPIRSLTWCHKAFAWLGSPLMNRKHEPAPRSNGRWDAAHEQVRGPPSDNAMELHCGQRGASQRLLFFSLLP